jgi:hypothetical protein
MEIIRSPRPFFETLKAPYIPAFPTNVRLGNTHVPSSVKISSPSFVPNSPEVVSVRLKKRCNRSLTGSGTGVEEGHWVYAEVMVADRRS